MGNNHAPMIRFGRDSLAKSLVRMTTPPQTGKALPEHTNNVKRPATSPVAAELLAQEAK